jgi:hypothetical protein
MTELANEMHSMRTSNMQNMQKGLTDGMQRKLTPGPSRDSIDIEKTLFPLALVLAGPLLLVA